MFDLTDRESFLNLDGWLKEIEKHCGNDVSIIVIGNKYDVGEPKDPNQAKDTDNNNEGYDDEDD